MDYIERFMRFKWGYSRYFTVLDFLKSTPLKKEKVFVLGSSIARDAVNCRYLDFLFPGLSFFNLGLPCHSAIPLSADFELDLVIKHKPKAVLLPTNKFLESDDYPVKPHYFLEFYEKKWRYWKKKYALRAVPGLFFPSPGHLHDLKDSRLRQYPWTNQELNIKNVFKKNEQENALKKIENDLEDNGIYSVVYDVPVRFNELSWIMPQGDWFLFRDDVHLNQEGYFLETMRAALELNNLIGNGKALWEC